MLIAVMFYIIFSIKTIKEYMANVEHYTKVLFVTRYCFRVVLRIKYSIAYSYIIRNFKYLLSVLKEIHFNMTTLYMLFLKSDMLSLASRNETGFDLAVLHTQNKSYLNL